MPIAIPTTAVLLTTDLIGSDRQNVCIAAGQTVTLDDLEYAKEERRTNFEMFYEGKEAAMEMLTRMQRSGIPAEYEEVDGVHTIIVLP